MDMQEHHLVMLMEECAEASQRASKQIRFGRDEVQPGQDLPNHWRLRDELLDVLACVRFLEQSGQIEPITKGDVTLHMQAKQAKIDRMLALSRSQGRLSGEPNGGEQVSNKSDGATHGVGCWTWHRGHYECALAEIERLQKCVAELERALRMNEREGLSPAALSGLQRMARAAIGGASAEKEDRHE